MYFMNHFITITADIKADIKPTAIITQESKLRTEEFLYKSYNVAANIIGIAKKKENSAAAFLDSPEQTPPIIVAPALDTPGMRDNICARPIECFLCFNLQFFIFYINYCITA